MRATRLLGTVAVAALLFGAVAVTPGEAQTEGLVAGGAQRGQILYASLVTRITPKRMENDAFGAVAIEVGNALSGGTGGEPKCDVALYRIDYETIGVHGEPATASEGLFVPEKGCSGPYPLVGYSHGTNVSKSQKIYDPASTDFTHTAPDSSPVTIATLLATHGYVVSATDYLGLGDSNFPYHPYLIAESEASAVVDAMRAARRFVARIGVGLTGDVFLTGHSQGGQSALATQRAIQREMPKEFRLRADAPSSGPYALTQTFLDSLQNPGEDAPIFSTYALTAFQKAYHNVYYQPLDVFKRPYAKGIGSLLPVANYREQDLLDGTTLPLSLSALLQPAFVRAFENFRNSGARIDTAQNDLLHGWTSRVPLLLCGGSQDPEVEYKNAILADQYFTAQGSAVTLVDVNQYLQGVKPQNYHVTVAFFCITIAKQQLFDQLRSDNRH
jgi:pimeloyl-ACP methyl ester carboxylesterase